MKTMFANFASGIVIFSKGCFPRIFDLGKEFAIFTAPYSFLDSSKETGLSRDHVICFDDIYKTIWTGNRRSGTVAAYTSYNSCFTSSHTNPV